MTRYWTSDLHLGHVRINELAQRPFTSVEEMNEEIIGRWNDIVKADDEVMVLGDLAMGRFVETMKLVETLNGHISLVPGNHDRVHPAYQDTRSAKVKEWEAMYKDAGIEILSTRITALLERNDSYKFVVASHFPYEPDDLGRAEYDTHRPKNEGRWLLHGHTHGRGMPPGERNPVRIDQYGKQLDVGVDLWDFRPISDAQVMLAIETTDDHNTK